MRFGVAQYGGLQAAERKFAVVVDVERPREFYKVAVAVLPEPADGGARRVLEAQQLAALVERFAGRIVTGTSDARVLESRFFHHEFRVPARNGEREERRLDIGIAEPGGGEVAFQVVHAVGRDLQVAGEAFRKTGTNEKRSHESRSGGVGDGVDVLELDAGFLDGGFGDGGDLLQVGACSDFGDDTAIQGVFVYLAVERVRKDFKRFVLQYGAGSFVAAGFDSKPDHSSSSSSSSSSP